MQTLKSAREVAENGTLTIYPPFLPPPLPPCSRVLLSPHSISDSGRNPRMIIASPSRIIKSGFFCAISVEQSVFRGYQESGQSRAFNSWGTIRPLSLDSPSHNYSWATLLLTRFNPYWMTTFKHYIEHVSNICFGAVTSPCLLVRPQPPTTSPPWSAFWNEAQVRNCPLLDDHKQDG